MTNYLIRMFIVCIKIYINIASDKITKTFNMINF